MKSNQELEILVLDNAKRISALESNHPQKIKDVTKEEFQNTKSKYTTNFIKSPKGNAIRQGSELWVRVRDADSVTGRISIRGRVEMIDQSTLIDEDNDIETINFKLRKRFRLFGKKDLPKGTYSLLIWWWDRETQRTGTYSDQFEII